MEGEPVCTSVGDAPKSLFLVSWCGLSPSPLGTQSTGLLNQPRMTDDDECVTVGGVSGRGN
jgi:hypothetical protein